MAAGNISEITKTEVVLNLKWLPFKVGRRITVKPYSDGPNAQPYNRVVVGGRDLATRQKVDLRNASGFAFVTTRVRR